MNFINFIKQDIEKNTEKIISSGNINKRFTLKKSNNIENNKFLNNIINNNNSKLIENNIIINNNPFITKIKWIKYNNYSCRYDSFLTLFIGCIYEFLDIFNNNKITHFNYLLDKCKLLINGDDNIVDIIWQYFIKNKLDVLKTSNKNGNMIILEDGYHQLGYVNQLFSIFDYSEYFCIQLAKENKCLNCGYNSKEIITNKKCLVSIDDNFLSLNSLDTIFLFLIPEMKKIKCQFCQTNLNTLEITYNINNYPKFLSLILDFDSYDELLKIKQKILNKIKQTIKKTIMNLII